MNTLSIADFTRAGAECGEAGILFADLEPSDIAPVERGPDPDVIPKPTSCQKWAFLLVDDSESQAAERYAWLLPDPPRIPRREATSTYLKFWLLVGGLVGMGALEVWGAVGFGKWVAGLVG